MNPTSLLTSAYRDSPLEDWYPAPYRELAAELAFDRARRRALLRYPLLLLRALRHAGPATSNDAGGASVTSVAGFESAEVLVGRVDARGRPRAGLPPLPAAFRPAWRARYLAADREEGEPRLAFFRGPGGLYLQGGSAALFEYELALARGARPLASPLPSPLASPPPSALATLPQDPCGAGAARRECVPSNARPA